MGLIASAALAPVLGGVPILVSAYIAPNLFPDNGLIFSILIAGMPIAVVLSMLTTYFLQSNELFEARHSTFYCSLFGGFFAAIATLGMLELSAYFWGVLCWGLISGAVFRWLLGDDGFAGVSAFALKGRIVRDIPAARYRLIQPGARAPRIGDIVGLDQGFSSDSGEPMTLVHGFDRRNRNAYGAELFDHEFEPAE